VVIFRFNSPAMARLFVSSTLLGSGDVHGRAMLQHPRVGVALQLFKLI